MALALCCLVPQRRFVEAAKAAEAAIALDPFSLSTLQGAANAALLARDYTRAKEYESGMEKLMPAYPGLHNIQSYRALHEHRHEDSLRCIDRFDAAIPGHPSSFAWRAVALAKLGNRDGAASLLGQLEEMAKTRYVQHYDVASVLAAIGDTDAAFRRLEHALDVRDGGLVYFASDIKFEDVLADPRTDGVLNRLGFGRAAT